MVSKSNRKLEGFKMDLNFQMLFSYPNPANPYVEPLMGIAYFDYVSSDLSYC